MSNATQKHQKTYEVITASPRARREYNVGGKKIKFDRRGIAMVHDAGIAKELDAMAGGKKTSQTDELRVIPVDNWKSDPTNVHRYSFGAINLDAPYCKEEGCRRKPLFNEYCPKHRPQESIRDGRGESGEVRPNG